MWAKRDVSAATLDSLVIGKSFDLIMTLDEKVKGITKNISFHSEGNTIIISSSRGSVRKTLFTLIHSQQSLILPAISPSADWGFVC